MSQDQKPYTIGPYEDSAELRREIERLQAELTAALKSRDRWRVCAKGLAEVLKECKETSEKKFPIMF
jgi:hypothetical protein